MRTLIIILALFAIPVAALATVGPPKSRPFDGVPDAQLTAALKASSDVTGAFSECGTKTKKPKAADCRSAATAFVKSNREFVNRAAHIASSVQTSDCKDAVVLLRVPGHEAAQMAKRYVAGQATFTNLYFVERTFLYKALAVHTACR